MNLKEAMAIVFDLANENALEERVADDAELGEEYQKQQAALETVHEFINSDAFKNVVAVGWDK